MAGGLLYPTLFAVSLVIGIAARSAGQYRATDLLLLLAVVVIVTLATTVLVRALLAMFVKDGRAAQLSALFAMLAVAWFFFYVPAQRTAEAISYRLSRDIILIPLGIVVTLGLTVWLLRSSKERLATINSFMTRFGVLLLVIVLFQLTMSQRGAPAAEKRSTLARTLAEPVAVDSAVLRQHSTPRRDIYLIVLDGHANSDVLRDVLSYDNSAFDDSLRSLGFTIPRAMRSNYTQTVLSVPSLLNASHVTQLSEDAGEENSDYSLPKYLVEHNRSATFLQRMGYRYVFFPSSWWGVTAYSPIADEQFDARPDFSLGNEARRTELRLAVLNSTLFKFARRARVDTLYDVRSMEGLKRIPLDTARTFVFAHFLLPHIPYFLDDQCRPLAKPIASNVEDASVEQRNAYLAQTKCVDRLVLDAVTSILRDSPVPPIVMIVGDHGSRFTAPYYYNTPDSVPDAFIRERFGAFGAFHMPAGGDTAFVDSVSLVNVMSNMLRYYFGADLPRQDDAMYVSGLKPYRYYRVAEERMRMPIANSRATTMAQTPATSSSK